MKTILYLIVSLDGKITRDEDDTEWVDYEDIDRVDLLMAECRVMLMGSKTFAEFGDELPNDKAKLIVFTNNPLLLNTKIENVTFTTKSPKIILSELDESGFTKVLIAGGQRFNTSLLNENLIDEIRLIVKPIVIGQGKSTFGEIEEIKKFKLSSVEKLANGTVELIFEK